MRRRLVALLLLLLACVLAALSLPFARSLAAGRQQEMFLDRLQDTNQFAAGAQQATTAVDQESLRADLARYAELYGITAAVISRGGTTWAVAGRLGELDDRRVAERITQARAGHQSPAPPTIWPWSDRPIVVAVPVVRADNVIAVAVTVSSSARLRAGIGRDLGLLLLADLTALGLLVAVAARLAAWVLRPVDVLDSAARRISTGALATRVDAGTGPVELRRLAATFNGMAQAVELAMQRQEAFVADASHQLRNPLSALVLRLDALGMDLDEEQRRRLEPAREEAARLGAILDELLELATAVHVAARPAEIDVRQLLRARLDTWQPVAEGRTVLLRGSDGDAEAPVPALADPVLISSALDSVLDNAVKFSPPGGEVVVGLAEEPAAVRVDVVDAGPGLSEEDLAHIGDRFWRSTAHQNIPGCGLGLSVARALLDATGGSLSFATTDPHGLHVTVRLPRAAAEAPSRAAGETS